MKLQTNTLARRSSAALAAILLLGLAAQRADSAGKGSPRTAAATSFKPTLPLFFEKNQGQADRRADFLARLPDTTLFLMGSDAVLVHSGAATHQSAALRMHWIGSRGTAPMGEAEMAGKSNYFVGSDQSRWRSGVSDFQRVRLNGLYPGVDLVYYGNQEQLEYDLSVGPGAATANIRLQIEGADKLRIDGATGDLLLVDATGSPLRLRKPVAYQSGGNDAKTFISAAYSLTAQNTVSFALGGYDRSRPLIIDPQVVYSTVWGGSQAGTSGFPVNNAYTGMTVDSNGFVYLGGFTTAINLPTTAGAFQPACNEYVSGSVPQCSNFFVAKFDPTQSGAASLVYATYIGGSSATVGVFQAFNPQSISDLAVDGNGDVYFTGTSSAQNYPTTSNAYAPACNLSGTPLGSSCPTGFLTELNPTGSALLYSTWLQPYYSGYNGARLVNPGMVAVDSSQVAYVAGPNGAGQFYLAAYATTLSGNASLRYAVSYSFSPTALAADAAGNVYLGGGNFVSSGNGANGTQFINLNGAQTSAPDGSEPGILVRFNSIGQNTYATLFGTASGNPVTGVSVDPGGTAYVTGKAADLTQVNGLPSAAGATAGAFVAKIDTTQSGPASLLYCTYLNAADPGSIGYGISSQGSGLIAFSGSAVSEAPYQLVNPLVQPASEPSELVTSYPYLGVIDTAKSGQNALIFFSFLDGVEYPYGVFLDQTNNTLHPTNNVYVAGSALTTAPASPFLGVPGSYLTTLTPSNNGNPVFFYKIALGPVDALSISPSILAFPNQELNTTSPPLSFTVTNTTSSSVSIDTVSASSQFNETDTCANSSLGAGASCTVQVTFEPTAITASTSFPTTGVISITAPGFNAPLAENVTGLGVSAGTPTGFFFPQSVAFGPQPNGSISSPVTVTLTNNGSVALAGEGGPIIFLSTYPGEFIQNSSTCGTSLASGASCQVTVAFAPTTTTFGLNGNSGSYTQTLNAFFNNSYQATLTLTGTGVAAGPSGTLSAGSLTFPSTTLGTTAQQSVTFTNTGNATLTGISVGNPAGGGAGSYSLSGNCLTTTSLAALGACTLTVTFDPQASGILAATVTITDNGVPSTHTLSLSGTGAPGTLQPQTITFGPLGNQVYGSTPPALSATASSGLPVSFASTTPGVCTVSGNLVTLAAAGTCTVKATQGGNSTYAAATPVNQSFQVTQAGQTITFGPLANRVYGSAPFNVSATASSGLAVSFASTTLTVCTVSGATVTIVSGGACNIQATQSGNVDYSAATPVSQGFQVTPASQTITFGPLSNQVYGTAPFNVGATASSGLPVSFASTTASVCTVSGSTVSLTGVGTCKIQATQAGNMDYSAAPPVNQSFKVTQSSQTITFGPISNYAFGSGPVTVSAAASSGLTVSFNSQTSSVCRVTGNSVTLRAVGTCTIQATQAGNADYSAATPVNQSFQITQGSQTITFGPLSNEAYGTAPFTVSATASSGLSVSFNSQTKQICTVSGTTVTLVGVGTCTVQAKQAGNANWAAAAPVSQSFTVTKGNQTITFGTLPGKTLGDPPFTISATASSGLTVSFSSSTASVCTVSGDTVTLVASGTCKIQAKQAGNADWNAAPSVTRSFTVAP